MKKQVGIGVGIGAAVGLLLTLIMSQIVRQADLRRGAAVLQVEEAKAPEKMVMVQHCAWCETPIPVTESEAKRRVALAKTVPSEASLSWREDPLEKDPEFATQLWRNGLSAASAGGGVNHAASGPCACGHVHSSPGFVPSAPVAGRAIPVAPAAKPAVQPVLPSAQNGDKADTVNL